MNGINSKDRFSFAKGYRARTIFLIFDILLLGILMCMMVLPLLKVIVDSIDPTSYGVRLWPRKIDFSAYEMILTTSSLYRPFLVSVLTTVVGTVTGLFIITMGAYVLIQKDMPGHVLMGRMVLFTMMFSGGMIPTYLTIKNLGLMNNMLAVIIPCSVSAYNTILMRSFFASIPNELFESATIGEPVESWPLPLPEVNAPYELTADDDFSKGLGIQWQWQANPKKEWYTAENGALTLPVLPCARGESLLWYMPNVLTQMPQTRAFTMQTTVTLAADGNGDEAGIAVMGHDYSALALHRGAAGNELVLYRGKVTARTAEGVAEEEAVLRLPFAGDTATLRLYFEDGGIVHYACEVNGQETPLDGSFPAAKSTWSGAKPALFARNTANRAGGQGRFGAVSFECL